MAETLWTLKTRILANCMLADEFNISSNHPLLKGVRSILLEPEIILNNMQTGAYDLEIKYAVDASDDDDGIDALAYRTGHEIMDRFLDILCFISDSEIDFVSTTTISPEQESEQKRIVIPGVPFYLSRPVLLTDLSLLGTELSDTPLKSLRWFRHSLSRKRAIDRFHLIAIAIELLSNEVVDELCEPEPKTCKACGDVYDDTPSDGSRFRKFLEVYGKISEIESSKIWRTRTAVKHGGDTFSYHPPSEYEKFFWTCRNAFLVAMKKILGLGNNEFPPPSFPDVICEESYLSIIYQNGEPPKDTDDIITDYSLEGFIFKKAEMTNFNLELFLVNSQDETHIRFVDCKAMSMDMRGRSENPEFDVIKIHHWRLIRDSFMCSPRIRDEFGFSSRQGIHIGIFTFDQARKTPWLEVVCKDIIIDANH